MENKLKPRKLTRKQKGFVNDYVATENGTQSALKHYDIKGKDKENIAHAIAVDNLRKPTIQKAIAERLPQELLDERHLDLLNKQETVLVKGVDENGNPKVEVIKTGEIDSNAVSKALDMAYKIKGSYVPDKVPTTINVVLVKFIDGKQEDKDNRDRSTGRISEAL